MAIEVFNRYENKYIMDYYTSKSIQYMLLEYMELDKHNRNDKFYTISNIYYDTCDNELIRKSIAKPKYKEKLRLRAYGVPDLNDQVFLEIKKKVFGLVNKRRTKLLLEEAYKFIRTKNKPAYQSYMNKQVLNEIEYFLNLYCLEPKIYIAYDRIAYFGINNKDLRVTFDTNIRTRRDNLKLEYGDMGKKLLSEDVWLMEVKAEKNIPLWMSRILSTHNMFKRGFSKYGAEYKSTILNNGSEEVLNNA